MPRASRLLVKGAFPASLGVHALGPASVSFSSLEAVCFALCLILNHQQITFQLLRM